jgi:hypothetical protein
MNDVADKPRESPTCKCDVCGEEMKHLGDLPNTTSFAAVRIFRCYGCNKVASEER